MIAHSENGSVFSIDINIKLKAMRTTAKKQNKNNRAKKIKLTTKSDKDMIYGYINILEQGFLVMLADRY